MFQAGPLTFGIVMCREGWRYPETVRWAASRGVHVVFHPRARITELGSYHQSHLQIRRTRFMRRQCCAGLLRTPAI